MKNKKYYAWACDFDANSGEGKLSREFLKFFYSKKKIKVLNLETPYKYYLFKNRRYFVLKKKKFFKNSFLKKYLTPYIGVYKLYIQKIIYKKKIIYLNYLPIWNFILFLILPKKTFLGPITGSDIFAKKNDFNNQFRKFFFPIFNFFSKSLIKNRLKNIFSTNLINYSHKNNIKNFQLIYFLNRNSKKHIYKNKSIDCLFYYRKHPNKNQENYFEFLKKMRKNGKNIKICGDKHNFFGNDNLGYLSEKKLYNVLSKSKFILASYENPISFFVQDALLNNVSIIFDLNNKKIITQYFKNCVFLNFSSINQNSLKIFNKKVFNRTSFKKNILLNLKRNLSSRLI